MKKSLRVIWTVLGVAAVAVLFFVTFRIQSNSRDKISDLSAVKSDETEIFQNSGTDINTITTPEESKREEKALPDKYLLSVPFQSQAPYGDWSQPYEDACEEASIIMIEHYLNGQSLSKEQMKSEIDASVAWQINNWGAHADLPANKILALATDYFKLSGKVVRRYSLADLKKYISSGVPILAPTDGQALGNPNFRGAGPEYHNLVIIGYDDTKGIFITNDPGTRNGKSYVYKYQTLIDAISGPDKDMLKEVVVLYK